MHLQHTMHSESGIGCLTALRVLGSAGVCSSVSILDIHDCQLAKFPVTLNTVLLCVITVCADNLYGNPFTVSEGPQGLVLWAGKDLTLEGHTVTIYDHHILRLGVANGKVLRSWFLVLSGSLGPRRARVSVPDYSGIWERD